MKPYILISVFLSTCLAHFPFPLHFIINEIIPSDHKHLLNGTFQKLATLYEQYRQRVGVNPRDPQREVIREITSRVDTIDDMYNKMQKASLSDVTELWLELDVAEATCFPAHFSMYGPSGQVALAMCMYGSKRICESYKVPMAAANFAAVMKQELYRVSEFKIFNFTDINGVLAYVPRKAQLLSSLLLLWVRVTWRTKEELKLITDLLQETQTFYTTMVKRVLKSFCLFACNNKGISLEPTNHLISVRKPIEVKPYTTDQWSVETLNKLAADSTDILDEISTFNTIRINEPKMKTLEVIQYQLTTTHSLIDLANEDFDGMPLPIKELFHRLPKRIHPAQYLPMTTMFNMIKHSAFAFIIGPHVDALRGSVEGEPEPGSSRMITSILGQYCLQGRDTIFDRTLRASVVSVVFHCTRAYSVMLRDKYLLTVPSLKINNVHDFFVQELHRLKTIDAVYGADSKMAKYFRSYIACTSYHARIWNVMDDTKDNGTFFKIDV